jgi:hypothetical protein
MLSELGPAFSAMEDDPDVRCGVLSPPGSNSIKSHSKKLAASDESTRLRNCRTLESARSASMQPQRRGNE